MRWSPRTVERMLLRKLERWGLLAFFFEGDLYIGERIGKGHVEPIMAFQVGWTWSTPLESRKGNRSPEELKKLLRSGMESDKRQQEEEMAELIAETEELADDLIKERKVFDMGV